MQSTGFIYKILKKRNLTRYLGNYDSGAVSIFWTDKLGPVDIISALQNEPENLLLELAIRPEDVRDSLILAVIQYDKSITLRNVMVKDSGFFTFTRNDPMYSFHSTQNIRIGKPNESFKSACIINHNLLDPTDDFVKKVMLIDLGVPIKAGISNSSNILLTRILSREINEDWLVDLIIGQNYLYREIAQLDLLPIDRFESIIWGNLNDTNKNKLIEFLNQRLKKDLSFNFLPCDAYILFNLICLACFIEQKIPGSVNKDILLNWRSLSCPNIKPKIVKSEINSLLEFAFLPEEYYLNFIGRYLPIILPLCFSCNPESSGKLHKFYQISYDSFNKNYVNYLCTNLDLRMIKKHADSLNTLLSNNLKEGAHSIAMFLACLINLACHLEMAMQGVMDMKKIVEWQKSDFKWAQFKEPIKKELNTMINNVISLSITK